MISNDNEKIIRLNGNLAWDLSEEESGKKGVFRKMWTMLFIIMSGIAIYAKLALWQHNKRVMEDEEE